MPPHSWEVHLLISHGFMRFVSLKSIELKHKICSVNPQRQAETH